jgi:RNA polymerase sigma factor (sigma-70 family)
MLSVAPVYVPRSGARSARTTAYVTIAMTETSTERVPSDAELISQVRAGDIDAYGLLYDRHRDAALRLSRQLASTGEAADLVSESFAKLLPILQGGGGPDISFRAYLLTCVRRVHIDRVRAGQRSQPTDDLEPFDPGTPFEDPAVDEFERTATARAFASLPERWQLVLWHTEVEGEKPGEIAPMLGMTANSVAALAHRAREGLRQAYLRSHLADTAEDSCRWVTEHLGGFVRGGLAQHDHTRVEEHLDDCSRCTAVYLELVEVNSNLRVVLAPLLLGSAAAGYLTAVGHTGLAATSPRWLRGRQVLRGHQGAAAAAVAAVALTAVAATAVIGTRDASSDHEASDGPDVSDSLGNDGSHEGGGNGPAGPANKPHKPSKASVKGDHPKRDRDSDNKSSRSDDRATDDDSSDSPSTDPTTVPTDEPSTEPTDPSDPTTDPTDPTSEPTTDPTTDPTEPTTGPKRPKADLGVGPRIAKHDFLGLLWNELTVPVDGTQKVDTATMVVTVENLTSWSTNGGSDHAAWSCSETGWETITCTLNGVDSAGQEQDLGLDVFTSSSSSEVTASISARGYRDPHHRNNSVSTTVAY